LSRRLLEALIDSLREHASLRVQPTDFRPETVPVHLHMRFRLTDEHGRFLGASRHLAQLKAQWGANVQGSFQRALQQAGLGVDSRAAGQRVGQTVSQTAEPLVDTARSASLSESGPRATLRQAEERYTSWTFGVLPELLELEVDGPAGRDTLIGYPALVDDGASVRIEVYDEPERARAQNAAGLSRLFRLALREPLRFFIRSAAELQRLSMLYMPFGGTDELREDLQQAVVMRTCMTPPWPENAGAFETRVAEARPRITLVGQEIARTLGLILEEHALLQRKLAGARTHPTVQADITAQLASLLPRDFLVRTPVDRLAHLPRYLKAVSARLDKLRADAARDARWMTELAPLLQNLQRARAALRGESDPRLEDFRWMIEELRVSLFAQELRTPMPVSVKRLQKIWESLR
jgi:ATP-dependent helicase HrpA